MKKLFTVVILVLALNFIAAVGAVGWLFKSGKLDKAKAVQIQELIFPPPAAPATQPSVSTAATQPSHRLEDLLARQTGRSTSEQVEFIQRSFDAQMLQLDRRQRELADLQRQVDLANQKLASDRSILEKDKQDLAQRQQEAAKQETDKGFQDSLALYQTMTPKQVKTIFLTLNDDTVMKYLQAMQPRTATKIIKEFKTPDETAFIERVLEKMRQPTLPAGGTPVSDQAAAAGGKQP